MSKTVNDDGNMGEPWGIACGNNGMWAVADNSKYYVYIFDGQDQLIRKIGNYGSGNGQFKQPKGVTFDNTTYLYATDYCNNRVQNLMSVATIFTSLAVVGLAVVN